jgi:polyhydroxyalkanoate synthase subunit PhaC
LLDAKELTFLADADAAGIVLGARVPIILTSRADNVRTRMASCAVAAITSSTCHRRIRWFDTWSDAGTPSSASRGAIRPQRTAILLWTLDAITTIVPDRKIHAAGYCLGGTLLSITAAAMARVGDHRLASATLLAAQTDFTEPGELALFIDHSQVHFLESMMWNKGYLSADQMAGAFALLRSNDLIWSHLLHDYLMGERTLITDLMAWNADSTRMPYRMHAEYLQRLYLDNELAAGRFMVDRRPAALQNIRVPLFVVGTERDHVAPWRSVYKIHYFTDTDLTFVLTSGGHNAGIVSEPGHPGRHFRIALKRSNDLYLGAVEWAAAAASKDGSWWGEWSEWLASHSAPERVPPPVIGSTKKGYPPMEDAPGAYVFQRYQSVHKEPDIHAAY